MEDILSYLIPSGSILLIIAVLIKICQFCSGIKPICNQFLDCFFHNRITNPLELATIVSTAQSVASNTSVTSTVTSAANSLASIAVPSNNSQIFLKKINLPYLPTGSVQELNMV